MTTEGLPGVGPSEASDLAGEGALLLDVREPEEWQAGHAPDVRHIPLGELERHLDELPRDRRLVLVCRSGHRSAHATAFLLEAGFDAANLEGGMVAWAAAGLPVVNPVGSPGTVI
jgi:rhodanese-related sulfurtransferase